MPATKLPEHPPDIAHIIRVFETIPHCRELQMKVVELRYGHGLMCLPYHRRLVGNPNTGVVHGGVITAFMDTICGLVVMASVAEGTPLATLDLRIDYLHPAEPEEDILGSAECYKVTDNIAFVRGIAYQGTFRDPIANVTGTFMLGSVGFAPERAQAGGKEAAC